MESNATATPTSSGVGGNPQPLTPTSQATPIDLPPLQTFLGQILLDKLDKGQEILDATVNSFKEEDVSSVSLLLTLYENSKVNNAGQETYNDFKKTITVNGRALSTMFWVLLGAQLDPLSVQTPQPRADLMCWGGGPAPPGVDARSWGAGSSPPTGGCEVLGGVSSPHHG